MDAIANLWEWVNHIPNQFTAEHSRDFLDAYPDYPVYSVVLFLWCVFYLPDYLRRNKMEFKMKYFVAAWNLFLSVVSTYGAYCTLRYAEAMAPLRSWHNNYCELVPTGGATDLISRRAAAVHAERRRMYAQMNVTDRWEYSSPEAQAGIAQQYNGRGAFCVAIFMYLKTPELLDTIFLILQDKPVSFLHWYHHIVTAIYCWQSGYSLIPSGVMFITMNYFVHSIMYFYYFLVVMGLRKSIRPFAPVITLLQVTQMFAGMYITVYTYFQYWLAPDKAGTYFYVLCEAVLNVYQYALYNARSLYATGALAAEVPRFDMRENFWGCDSDPTNMRMGMMMYGSYCVLFAVLFKELYLDKRAHKNSLVLSRKEGQKAKVEAGTAAAEKKEKHVDVIQQPMKTNKN